MRPPAIVQARMNSRRLSGKSVRSVRGRAMLAYVVERLQHCREIDGVIVATSVLPEDDAIAELCRTLGVSCHRGPLDDVLGRFLAVFDAVGLAAAVRVNGDSPLIDPALVDRGVRLFGASDCELVTNVAPRTFPRGQSVEVVSAAALRRIAAASPTAEEREHVTLWLYRRREQCAIVNFTAATDMSDVQLSVDTAEDFARFAAMVEAMDRPHWEYGLDDILALRRSLPAGAEAG